MLLQKEKGKGKKIVPQSFKLRKERNIKGWKAKKKRKCEKMVKGEKVKKKNEEVRSF